MRIAFPAGPGFWVSWPAPEDRSNLGAGGGLAT
jgi:hypothetical protein